MVIEPITIKKNKNRLAKPCKTCPTPCDRLRTKGKRSAKILVVTKPPKREQHIRYQRYFNPHAWEAFIGPAKSHGFSEDDFVFHAAVRCYYDPDRTEPQQVKWTKENCREYLLRVIEKAEPDIIIPLGAEACEAVYGRNKKITKVRGLADYVEDYQAWVYPMLDPDYVSMYPQNMGLAEADWRRLRALIENGFDQQNATHGAEGDYQIIDDLEILLDANPAVLAYDIEAMGLRWVYPEKKLLTMQFCHEPGKAYLLSWDHPDRPMSRRNRGKIRRQLEQLLCDPERTIIGHNLKHDCMWTWEKIGIRFRIGGDTLNLAAEYDENLINKDLSTLTKIFLPHMAGYDDWFNAQYDKAHMEQVPLTDIVKYGCGDVDATFQLFDILEGKVYEDEQMANHYETVVIPGLNTFASIERRGMLINPAKLDELEDEVSLYVEQLYDELLDEVPRSIKRKHVREHKTHNPAEALKFSRPSFLQDILFDHPDGFRLTPRVFTKKTEKLDPHLRKPSLSSKDHLPFFFEECPFTEKLAEYIKLKRLLETNIQGFREKYLIEDKIYPSYTFDVTVTGRTSSRDPNAQNFPKRGRFAKTYRSIFLPPPGRIMLEADLSQAELRIAADMAVERHMLSIYQTGGDIHLTTALIVSGKTAQQFAALPKDEQDLYRFKAKAVNFGFIYGMGWRKFIIYAKTQYGVEFTDTEAQRIREEFFRRYPRLRDWHTATRLFARNNKFVRSYSGRVRHLPMIDSPEEYIQQEAERQAINSPVQGFASDLGVIAASRIDQQIDPQYLAISGFVHDALYAHTEPQYLEWAAKTLKYYMENVPIERFFGRRMRVPIAADVSFGFDGGKQWELKNLDLNTRYDFEEFEARLLERGDIEEPLGLPEQLIPPNDGLIELPEHLVLPMVA